MTRIIRKPRPRLYGKLSKPAPISFTQLQDTMHKASQTIRSPAATRGAFGGVAQHNRPIKAPKDLLPATSAVS